MIAQSRVDAHKLQMKSSLHTLAVIGLLGVVAGCDRTPPAFSDEEIAELRAEYPGFTDNCLGKLQISGFTELLSQTDRCFKLTSSKRWAGVYVDSFENQLFCPDATDRCEFDPTGERIWTNFKTNDPLTRLPTERIYAIEFFGRRTLLPGQHGHLGSFNHEILVDELVSIVPIADVEMVRNFVPDSQEEDEKAISGSANQVAKKCADQAEQDAVRRGGRIVGMLITSSPKWGTILRADVAGSETDVARFTCTARATSSKPRDQLPPLPKQTVP